MRYILLGSISGQWLDKQKERTGEARKKLDALGITLKELYYTQGAFDFVDVIEAPDAEAVLAFSAWYTAQGYGKIVTQPAFTEAEMEAAIDRL